MTSEGSPEANATLLRDSIAAFNGGDMTKLLAVAAPDIIIHYAEMPEPLQGRETWQQDTSWSSAPSPTSRSASTTSSPPTIRSPSVSP